MKWKSILCNSITVSLPKNVVQFLLGVTLFWLIFGQVNVNLTVTALIAFLLTYSSVYLFNDLTDYKEDRKDKEKLKWKLIANNELSHRIGLSLCISLMVLGLILAFFVNKWFAGIMISLLFLNFLHSSPFTKFKSRLSTVTINITLIEFLKYSAGWFALTANISKFPFWLILCFSLAYLALYFVYKFKFKGKVIKRNKFVFFPLGCVVALSYLLSLFLYNFPLSLIFLLSFSLILLFSTFRRRIKFMNWFWVEFIVLPMIIISFILVINPTMAKANDYMSSNIEIYKEKLSATLPPSIIDNFENISKTLEKYETLDDVEQAINKTLNLNISSS